MQNKNYRIEIKWGAIIIGMMLLWNLLEKSVGLHSKYISKQQLYSNFIIIPFIIIYIMALMDKRKNFYNGSMTYKEAFKTGFLITLIIALFSPISQFITTELISPDYFPNMIRYSVMQEKLSQQEAVKFYNLSTFMIISIIGSFFYGLVITSIVSAFVKTKNRHHR